MRPAIPALLAALLGGVALAQPSQPLQNAPPRASSPAQPGPEARTPAPGWPPLPPPLAAEPPAMAALRGLLGPEVGFGVGAAAQLGDTLTLDAAEFRRGHSRLLVLRLVLDGLSGEGLRRGEARGVTGETPEGPFAVEALDLTGLALLPLEPGQAPGERLAHQVALETLRLAGFTLGGAQPARLARLELAGWRPGVAAHLGLAGLDVALPPGGPVDRITLDGAAVEGHDLAAMLGVGRRGELPPAPGNARQVKRAEGFLALSQGRRVGGIARLLIESETAADGTARARLGVHDAFLEQLPGAAALFEAVGLPRLSLELAIEGSYAPGPRRLVLSTLAFGVRDLGALAIGGVFDGIEPGGAQPNPETTRLLEGRLRYLDQSLYARVVTSQATREHLPEALVRQRHAEMLAALLTGQPPDPALDGLREALLRFVRGQAREIELALRPAQPVPFAALPVALGAGPAEVVRLLGLGAKAR